MAKIKEVRIRFYENEIELYEYINSKRSASGFLKDLAEIERKREQNYVNNNIDINILLEKIAGLNIPSSTSSSAVEEENVEEETDLNSFIDDFDDEFDDEFDD